MVFIFSKKCFLTLPSFEHANTKCFWSSTSQWHSWHILSCRGIFLYLPSSTWSLRQLILIFVYALSHDFMAYFSWSADYRLRQDIKVRIFVDGKIWRSTNDRKLIHSEALSLWVQQLYTSDMTPWSLFHGLLTSYFWQFSMVKIFVIGKVLCSTDGSKLIFY